ncbi:MAG TPA: rubrerythrin [Chromatiaceae bacterium]|jgi:rubrerythrin|nr:MAG: hypothetical protein N838_08000 [Thiohalocapsa sp. PB-PSB1]QQO55980.1 MAG: ferritin family protein [Thiohalocapsa sp. PB-PSB1]HBG94336.1 rubrerythrin [Chromatiaceae bacterium]HCS89270.1 rubrerythrin [Chromatiaceae bacterium]
MNDPNANHPSEPAAASARIDDVGEFLLHALELEHESAARYEQLADSMEVHHNQEVATLFRRLARLSDEHAARIGKRASGIALPQIAPWEFKWNFPEGSDVGHSLDADVNYQMSALQALELALHNETRGQAFYARTAAESTHPEVRRLAEKMRAEEEEHRNLLRELIAQQRPRVSDQQTDLDPPHMPG